MPAAERSPVAQLAEHPAVNRRVVGSSPTRGALLSLYLERVHARRLPDETSGLQAEVQAATGRSDCSPAYRNRTYVACASRYGGPLRLTMNIDSSTFTYGFLS